MARFVKFTGKLVVVFVVVVTAFTLLVRRQPITPLPAFGQGYMPGDTLTRWPSCTHEVGYPLYCYDDSYSLIVGQAGKLEGADKWRVTSDMTLGAITVNLGTPTGAIYNMYYYVVTWGDWYSFVFDDAPMSPTVVVSSFGWSTRPINDAVVPWRGFKPQHPYYKPRIVVDKYTFIVYLLITVVGIGLAYAIAELLRNFY